MFQVKSVNSEGIESPSEVITSGLPSLLSAPLVQQLQLSRMTTIRLVLQVTIDVCYYYHDGEAIVLLCITDSYGGRFSS